jgi:hypothetical protein
MIAKTSANMTLPAPNRGGFSPTGAVVFELVVIGVAFFPSQTYHVDPNTNPLPAIS